MRTAEKNRRECSRGKALAAIEAHLEYLDNCPGKLNQEIEKLTQANQQGSSGIVMQIINLK